MDIDIVLEHAGGRQVLSLSIDEHGSTDRLYEAVAQRIGAQGQFHLRRVDDNLIVGRDTDVSQFELAHGDHVRVETTRQEPTRQDAANGLDTPAILAEVLDGPHAGDHPTFDGQFEIGRKTKNGLTLSGDNAATKSHSLVSLRGDVITISDLGSTNGTFVNGSRISSEVELTPGDEVRVGNSRIRLSVLAPRQEQAHLRYDRGRIQFNRPARMLRRRPALTVEVPRAPDSPTKRRFPKAAMLGPAVMGLPMFFLAHGNTRIVSVAMMLGSPMLALYSWWDDRSSGRNEFRSRADAYKASITAVAENVQHANERSSTWRAERNPPMDELVRRAKRRATELWQRDSLDDDFLELRVGELDQTSLAVVKVGIEGDPELRRFAAEHVPDRLTDALAPVVIPIGRLHEADNDRRDLGGGGANVVDVVGVVGDLRRTADLTRALILQLAVHHSPQDLALAVLVPGLGHEYEWLRWLPHTEQLAGEGQRPTMLAFEDSDATKIFNEIKAYAKNRVEASRETSAGSGRFKPHVLLLAALPLRVADNELSAFLDQLPDANMSVILLAPDRRMLPRQADVVITAVDGRLDVDFVRVDVEMRGVIPDSVSVADADSAARRLAALRDSSASGASAGIPNRINLLQMLDLVPLTTDIVMQRWAAAPEGIRAPIGLEAGGTLDLELAPHGLVAGTTGAGKSELLQTYVASLALTYPPERLNFVFVDFKGGLAFNQCVDLPHAVGLITNLDGHLAERVMQSLQAELEGRTKVINALGGGDLKTLAMTKPDQTPPALVIIFDEFREAVERVPQRPGEPGFIDRVMSLARLGRQLGMHVILATQTPDGVVTDDLKNNIDLRVALRVKTTEASRSIIGRPDAALVTKRTPGRGYAQLEAGDTREFQTAYVGGISTATDDDEIDASLHTVGRRPRKESAKSDRAGLTDLETIVAVTREAAAMRRTAAPRQPWLPELAPVLPLREVLEAAPKRTAGSFSIPLGRSDEPMKQAQQWFSLELDRSGSCLVFGAGGSGKTSILRSAAASAAALFSPADLHIYALDFTGQSLAVLSSLPHCAATATARDTDRVRKIVTMLRATIDERQSTMQDHGASSVAELQAKGHKVPSILLLVDGLTQFRDAFEDERGDSLFADLDELLQNGRSAAIYSIVTASRSNLPTNVINSFALRLVLRMNSSEEYSQLGVPRAADLMNFPPGRAFAGSSLEVQVGVLIPRIEPGMTAVDTGTQNATLEMLGRNLSAAWQGQQAPQLQALPREVALEQIPVAARTWSFPFALDELTVRPVAVDLERATTMLVIGPEQSGKTTAIASISHQFMTAWPEASAYLLCGRRSSLQAAPWRWTDTKSDPRDVASTLRELSGTIRDRARDGYDEPMLIVMDDADGYGGDPVRDYLDDLFLSWRDGGVAVIAGLTNFSASKNYSGWYRFMKAAKQGILLTPTDLHTDGELLDARLPNRSRLELPPGRGFLLDRKGYKLVQTARPSWL